MNTEPIKQGFAKMSSKNKMYLGVGVVAVAYGAWLWRIRKEDRGIHVLHDALPYTYRNDEKARILTGKQ